MEQLLLAAVMMLSLSTPSSHATKPSTLGTVSDMTKLEASLARSGIVELETVASADWQIDRSGLINLAHPEAKAAGLEDGLEPIQIFFHVIRHPTKGTFIVDTGMETALRDDPSKSALGGLVRSAMRMDLLKMNLPLGDFVAKEGRLDGVLLTHLHLDHVAGMRDVPSTTPIYAGPGETSGTGFMNAFTRGSIDAALEGKQPISEFAFSDGHDVIDVFGDGSVWALWIPGHTKGSTAYVVRATTGTVLLTGDGSHTRWGWEHAVEPGTFTADLEQSRRSFERLQKFSKAHPEIEVRLGHQR
ncbi:MAG: MBL fold metallo-hydrolase [Archangium sp.]